MGCTTSRTRGTVVGVEPGRGSRSRRAGVPAFAPHGRAEEWGGSSVYLDDASGRSMHAFKPRKGVGASRSNGTLGSAFSSAATSSVLGGGGSGRSTSGSVSGRAAGSVGSDHGGAAGRGGRGGSLGRPSSVNAGSVGSGALAKRESVMTRTGDSVTASLHSPRSSPARSTPGVGAAAGAVGAPGLALVSTGSRRVIASMPLQVPHTVQEDSQESGSSSPSAPRGSTAHPLPLRATPGSPSASRHPVANRGQPRRRRRAGARHESSSDGSATPSPSPPSIPVLAFGSSPPGSRVRHPSPPPVVAVAVLRDRDDAAHAAPVVAAFAPAPQRRFAAGPRRVPHSPGAPWRPERTPPPTSPSSPQHSRESRPPPASPAGPPSTVGSGSSPPSRAPGSSVDAGQLPGSVAAEVGKAVDTAAGGAHAAAMRGSGACATPPRAPRQRLGPHRVSASASQTEAAAVGGSADGGGTSHALADAGLLDDVGSSAARATASGGDKVAAAAALPRDASLGTPRRQDGGAVGRARPGVEVTPVRRFSNESLDSAATTTTAATLELDAPLVAAQTADGDVPAANGDAPAASGDALAASGDAPAANGDAPAVSGDAPAANGDAPAVSGDAGRAGAAPEIVGAAGEAPATGAASAASASSAAGATNVGGPSSATDAAGATTVAVPVPVPGGSLSARSAGSCGKPPMPRPPRLQTELSERRLLRVDTAPADAMRALWGSQASSNSLLSDGRRSRGSQGSEATVEGAGSAASVVSAASSSSSLRRVQSLHTCTEASVRERAQRSRGRRPTRWIESTNWIMDKERNMRFSPTKRASAASAVGSTGASAGASAGAGAGAGARIRVSVGAVAGGGAHHEGARSASRSGRVSLGSSPASAMGRTPLSAAAGAIHVPASHRGSIAASLSGHSRSGSVADGRAMWPHGASTYLSPQTRALRDAGDAFAAGTSASSSSGARSVGSGSMSSRGGALHGVSGAATSAVAPSTPSSMRSRLGGGGGGGGSAAGGGAGGRSVAGSGRSRTSSVHMRDLDAHSVASSSRTPRLAQKLLASIGLSALLPSGIAASIASGSSRGGASPTSSTPPGVSPRQDGSVPSSQSSDLTPSEYSPVSSRRSSQYDDGGAAAKDWEHHFPQYRPWDTADRDPSKPVPHHIDLFPEHLAPHSNFEWFAT